MAGNVAMLFGYHSLGILTLFGVVFIIQYIAAFISYDLLRSHMFILHFQHVNLQCHFFSYKELYQNKYRTK